ncbi:L,D-transpeptidase [Akkermansiaceae bacterium]|nr:L,D-transpeptidase [Akkermansiaceae bacterium]
MRDLSKAPMCIIPLLLASCGLMNPEPPKKAEIVMYEWEDTGEGEPLSIRINLKEQKAAYMRGDRQVGWSYVSTGREGHSTPVGDFRITEKMPLKVSNRYGWIADPEGKVAVPSARAGTPVPPGHVYRGSEMQNWMRLTSYGVGLHAGEISKPGQALSHGCIRLPRDFVPKLYAAASLGTPVRITRG